MNKCLPPRQDGLRRSKRRDTWFSEAPQFMLLEQKRYWGTPFSREPKCRGPCWDFQGSHPHFTYTPLAYWLQPQATATWGPLDPLSLVSSGIY